MPSNPSPQPTQGARTALIGAAAFVTLLLITLGGFFAFNATRSDAADTGAQDVVVNAAPTQSQAAPAPVAAAPAPAPAVANPAASADTAADQAGPTPADAAPAPAPADPAPAPTQSAPAPAPAPTQSAPEQDPAPAAAAPAPAAAAADSAPEALAIAPPPNVERFVRCHISKTQIAVGETTVFTASIDAAAGITPTFAFDHGDGTIDHRNPSHAFYYYPGTYYVTAIATTHGHSVRVPCGTVTVTDHAPHYEHTCHVSDRHISVGETTTYTGSSTPASAALSYSFDHGDGYVDNRNPSHAVYTHPGNYTVTMFVDDSDRHHREEVHCGTVTVTQRHFEYRCHVSRTHIKVGETTTITASSEDPTAWYSISHGDGTVDHRNPSHAYFAHAGTYYPTVEVNGGLTTIQCPAITVTHP